MQAIMNDAEVREIMGYRLSALRNLSKMNQAALAKKLGCSQKYISAWECGHKWIPTKYLMKICEVFEVNAEYFNPRNPGPEENIENSRIDNSDNDNDKSIAKIIAAAKAEQHRETLAAVAREVKKNPDSLKILG